MAMAMDAKRSKYFTLVVSHIFGIQYTTMKIAVVLPGFNEEKYIGQVLRGVRDVADHVIYVDDGSSDKSTTIARRLIDHVVVHETNLGKGAAMKTGCEYAFRALHADAVVFMDADNQHDPKELPRFFHYLKQDNQVIFGVRKFSSTMPLMRLLGNKSASILLNILFGAYIPDIPSGFKAMTKSAYEKLHWKSKGYEVETEIAARVAQKKIPYHVVEIEAIYHDKEKGMTVIDAMHIAKSLIQWKFGL